MNSNGMIGRPSCSLSKGDCVYVGKLMMEASHLGAEVVQPGTGGIKALNSSQSGAHTMAQEAKLETKISSPSFILDRPENT
jgi:hypothetical protein